MFFTKQKTVELSAWMLRGEQFVRQALEVYSGGVVRFESLDVVLHDAGDNYYTRRPMYRCFTMTGVVVGKELAEGKPQKFEVHVRMWNHYQHGWCPQWNGFDLKVGSGTPWQQYWVFFDDTTADKPGEVLPQVSVQRDGDKVKAIGRHLADRRLEPIAAVA